MATTKKRKSSKKTAAKKRAKPRSVKAARKRAAGGKVKGKATLEKLAKAVNRLDSRVDTLEVNDAANQRLWLGVINSGRKRNGQKSISTLPGFAKPRLYSPGSARTKRLSG